PPAAPGRWDLCPRDRLARKENLAAQYAGDQCAGRRGGAPQISRERTVPPPPHLPSPIRSPRFSRLPGFHTAKGGLSLAHVNRHAPTSCIDGSYSRLQARGAGDRTPPRGHPPHDQGLAEARVRRWAPTPANG